MFRRRESFLSLFSLFSFFIYLFIEDYHAVTRTIRSRSAGEVEGIGAFDYVLREVCQESGS